MSESRSSGRIVGALAALTLVGASLGVFPAAAGAAPKGQELVPRLEGQALVDSVKQGGKVILLRHTSTESRSDETIKFRVEDCSTQRNLSEEGKQEAKAIGEAITKLGIKIDTVYASPYCRTLETGRLAFGKATPSETLAVGDRLSMDGKLERAAEIRKLLDTAPPAGTNVVLITHTGNLLYAFGLDSRPEGIAHIFEPTGTGRANYLGRMNPDDWTKLSGQQAGVQAKP
jgi:phosphohistidine phosphatase SixA